MTKIIFERPSEWESVTNADKKKHYFMTQRRFSINFPLQANALQSLRINQVAVIDFWQQFMQKQYQRTPSWMYIKGIKKSKESKETKNKVSESLISEYAKKMQIDRKSVVDALEFYPKDIVKELKSFEKMIKQK